MADPTAFMTLPPELREHIYKYIALSHRRRRVQSRKTTGIVLRWEHKITSSAMTATCQLIHSEYEAIARKTTTQLDFTAHDLDFSPVVDYFDKHVDTKYLRTLRNNNTTLNITIDIHDSSRMKRRLSGLYHWNLFLLQSQLQETYTADPSTWLKIFDTTDADVVHLCNTRARIASSTVRENIDAIQEKVKAFIKAADEGSRELRLYQGLNLEFADFENRDVLDRFDFDSFLVAGGDDDDGFDFDARFPFGDETIEEVEENLGLGSE